MMHRVAEIADLPFSVRLFLAAYRWRKIDPLPWSVPRLPLRDSRIALVSTAGLVAPGQTPFDEHVKGGDWSYREIPDDADVASLVEYHRSQSFDHSGVAADANVAFPLDRLHELAAAGVIGSCNRRHFSFMGSITAPGRLIQRSAPEVADALVQDAVDAVVLVPI